MEKRGRRWDSDSHLKKWEGWEMKMEMKMKMKMKMSVKMKKKMKKQMKRWVLFPPLFFLLA